MLVPTWMGINMADENQQKHLLPSIEELITIKVILFLIHEPGGAGNGL